MATVAAYRAVFVNVTQATWAVRVSFKVETPSALATARQAVAPIATARASAGLLGEQGVKVIAVDMEFAVERLRMILVSVILASGALDVAIHC